eukprot:m.205283 g.205283  ORF g.205283 m.205283 type:complete len:330 (-) comp15404_c0_seq1:410-1399(-)
MFTLGAVVRKLVCSEKSGNATPGATNEAATTAAPLPSVNGELFVYKTGMTMAAFLTAPRGARRGVVVMVPGLTDGLLCPRSYAADLAQAAVAAGWGYTQPVLSSSYLGYGIASLDTDATELDALLESPQLANDDTVVIVGHSTGCQDAVHYLKVGKHRARVKAVVLQAPCSDREAAVAGCESETSKGELLYAIKFAENAVAEGKGDVLMPRSTVGTYGTPITAERFHSLNGRMTLDDMFSSDLTRSELSQRLSHIGEVGSAVRVVYSGADEFQPAHIDKKEMAAKLCAASGSTDASWRIIDGASHALEEPNHASQFVSLVRNTLQSVSK